MKRGFTLIELLAVIVILAIVALIATPIILGIIGDSKEQADKVSAEMYLKAVKTATMKPAVLDSIANATCEIQSNGYLDCGDVVVPIHMDNSTAVSGTIEFTNGEITNVVNLKMNDKYYNYDSNKNLVASSESSVATTPSSCFDYAFECYDDECYGGITDYTCDYKDVVLSNTAPRLSKVTRVISFDKDTCVAYHAANGAPGWSASAINADSYCDGVRIKYMGTAAEYIQFNVDTYGWPLSSYEYAFDLVVDDVTGDLVSATYNQTKCKVDWLNGESEDDLSDEDKEYLAMDCPTSFTEMQLTEFNWEAWDDLGRESYLLSYFEVEGEHENAQIVAIDDDAFKDKAIESINISDDIQYIGDYAFYGNNLDTPTYEKIFTLNPLAIEERTSIINSLVIGCYVYYVNYDDNYAYLKEYTCTSTTATIPNAINGAPIIGINPFAFANHPVTSVNIPDSINIISGGAFCGSNITDTATVNKINELSASAGFECIFEN